MHLIAPLGTSLENPELGWEMDQLESVYWTSMRT